MDMSVLTATQVPPQGSRPGVLIVLEESELGRHAATLGVAMAARLGSCAVFLAALPVEHVEAKSASGVARELAEREQRGHDRAAPWFAMATALADAAGVERRKVLSFDEDPVAVVQKVTQLQQCELVVVGSHGRGAMSRVLHGSLVSDLVRLSQVPVLVCREGMALSVPATGASAPGR
jgi:nucleotide-binding universal stress UspA family protein